MSTWAKGPWETGPPHVVRRTYRDDEGRRCTQFIAECCIPEGSGPDDVAANARLISAAPEMAEALEAFANVRIERAIAETEKTNPFPDDKVLFGYDNWNLTVGMVRAARAALAKAKGETT